VALDNEKKDKKWVLEWWVSRLDFVVVGGGGVWVVE